MWWCTELECFQKEAELLLSLLFADTEQSEDLGLDILFVDTDRSATQLCTVQYDVISDRLDIFDLFIIQCAVFGKFGHREGVMKGFDLAIFDFEHREIHYPEELKAIFRDDLHQFGEIDTETSHIVQNGSLVAGTEEDDIAHSQFASIDDRLQIRFAEEFGQWTLQAILFHLEIAQTLRTKFTHIILEALHLSLGEDIVAVWHLECFDTVLFWGFGDL